MTKGILKAHNFETETKGTGQDSFLTCVSVRIGCIATKKKQFLSG